MQWIWKWLIVTGASGLVAVLVLVSPNKAERTPQAPAFHGTRVDEAPILRIPRVRATVGRWQGRSNVANASARHVASTAMFAPVVGHHFDPWVSYPVDLGGTYSVAIGDVTGDKRDDLVVATYRYDLPGDSSVLVYRQASNGTLLAPDKYPHYGGPDPALALAHLNGDDVLDIVVGRDRGLTTLVHSGAGFVVTKVDASSAFFDRRPSRRSTSTATRSPTSSSRLGPMAPSFFTETEKAASAASHPCAAAAPARPTSPSATSTTTARRMRS